MCCSADDALSLRPWVQPALDGVSASNQMNKPARGIPVPDVVAATRRLLSDGPLPVKELGGAARRPVPRGPGAALGHLARERAPLVQLPPRGCGSAPVGSSTRPSRTTWVGRRPRSTCTSWSAATCGRSAGHPADITTWSRVTRLGPVFASMSDELVIVDCEDGRRRYDVPGAPYVEGGEQPPSGCWRLRQRLALARGPRPHRRGGGASRWAGTNGGVGNTIFVDGFMAGLWWVRDGRIVMEVFAQLSRREQSELDARWLSSRRCSPASAKPLDARHGIACSGGRTVVLPGGRAGACVPYGARSGVL